MFAAGLKVRQGHKTRFSELKPELRSRDQEVDQVNCVNLKLLLHYIVLLNMAMTFPVLDAKDASLPTTISCKLNLQQS